MRYCIRWFHESRISQHKTIVKKYLFQDAAYVILQASSSHEKLWWQNVDLFVAEVLQTLTCKHMTSFEIVRMTGLDITSPLYVLSYTIMYGRKTETKQSLCFPRLSWISGALPFECFKDPSTIFHFNAYFIASINW